MKTSDLTGAQLDYWVAKAEGRNVEIIDQGENPVSPRFYASLKPTGAVWWPSSKWAQGGPIIEREEIVMFYEDSYSLWNAGFNLDVNEGYSLSMQNWQVGPTALIAAMRAYVAFKFGDEVSDDVA